MRLHCFSRTEGAAKNGFSSMRKEPGKALVQNQRGGRRWRVSQFVPVEELFAGRHFDADIVVLCVRWYLSFKLSYRDLVSMMSERGIVLAHTTILRWVQHYTPEFESAGSGTPARWAKMESVSVCSR